ncbi:MAG: hypothetical protein HZB43_02535 [candidate division Zixibacteria bacterium]|nr:hypothetical protein [candidate division Zixibacteria bacterium]
MKKALLLTLAMLVLVVPCTAFAGSQEVEGIGDKYYRIQSTTPGPDTLNFKPTWNGSAWVWNTGVLTAGVPPASTPLPAGNYLVLAMENFRIAANMKFVTVKITYTGTSTLQFQLANYGSKNGLASFGEISSETASGSPYQLIYKIRPQPDWEWLIIRNTGGSAITMTEVSFGSNCEYVPSLTTWGLLALVLLLAGTAFFMVKRRRLAIE